jgi:hypothetical protein
VVAHKLADCCLSHDMALHSQHIKGTCNVIADARSCLFGMSNAYLTTYCHKHFPLQLPQDFQICQLPAEIISRDFLHNSSCKIVESSKAILTTTKCSRNWQRWTEYLGLIGLQLDPFLDHLLQWERQRVAQGFLQSIREGSFSKPSPQGDATGNNSQWILGRSIKETPGHLAKEFWCYNQQRPFHVNEGAHHLVPELKALFRAWENIDPPVSPGAAIISENLRYILETTAYTKNQMMLHQAHLLTTALFFAM